METFWWKSGGKYSVENIWWKIFGRNYSVGRLVFDYGLWLGRQRQLCLYVWREIDGDTKQPRNHYQSWNIAHSASGRWSLVRQIFANCFVTTLLNNTDNGGRISWSMTLSIYSWLDSMEYWRVGILTNGYDGQGVVARFEYQSINQNVIPGTQSGKILTIEILCKQITKILVTLIGQGFFMDI